MRRWLITLFAVTILVALAFFSAFKFFVRDQRPIRVGILHSKTGAMAISEESMIHAEVLALEEIKESGGLLGRDIEWIIADGKSDWPTFASEAQRLIEEEKVNVIFGCWTSASRRSVKPVVERNSHLLIYPMAYEGLEDSANIVYTGAAPNQQVIPAVSWCFEALKARKFFLVGSDYVWPHCVNEIIKDELKALGAECAGEAYILFGSTAVGPAVEGIKKANPDVIVSTVVGDSNEAFYQRLHAAGVRPERTPVLSFSIAEDELRKLPVPAMVGDYAAWDYFQGVGRPENREFVQRFQARYGRDRVTSDVIEAAYNSVYLWKQAVLEAESAEVADVLRTVGRQSLNAPEGIISVDEETRHTWRPVFVGRIRRDGQFDLVWSSEKPVRPIPYPPSRSRPEWKSFLDGLYQSWGGAWANPGVARGQARATSASGTVSGPSADRSLCPKPPWALDRLFTPDPPSPLAPLPAGARRTAAGDRKNAPLGLAASQASFVLSSFPQV
jgi:urea transport system substrate-binding protein